MSGGFDSTNAMISDITFKKVYFKATGKRNPKLLLANYGTINNFEFNVNSGEGYVVFEEADEADGLLEQTPVFSGADNEVRLKRARYQDMIGPVWENETGEFFMQPKHDGILLTMVEQF